MKRRLSESVFIPSKRLTPEFEEAFPLPEFLEAAIPLPYEPSVKIKPTSIADVKMRPSTTASTTAPTHRLFASSKVSVQEATFIVEGFLDFYNIRRDLVVNWNRFKLPTAFQQKANVLYYQIHDTEGFYQGINRGSHNIATVTFNSTTAINDSLGKPTFGKKEGFIPYTYFAQKDLCSCGYSASMFVIYCICQWVTLKGNLDLAKLAPPPVNLYPSFADSPEYAVRHLQMSFYFSCHHYKLLAEKPLGFVPELRYRFTAPKLSLALQFDELDPKGRLREALGAMAKIKDPDVTEFLEFLTTFWFLYDRRALILLDYMDEIKFPSIAKEFSTERKLPQALLPWQRYVVYRCQKPPKPDVQHKINMIPSLSTDLLRLCEFSSSPQQETLQCFNPERKRNAPGGTFDALLSQNGIKGENIPGDARAGGSADCVKWDFRGKALSDIVETFEFGKYLFFARFYTYKHLIELTRGLLVSYDLIDLEASGVRQVGQQAIEDSIGLGSCAACRENVKPLEKIREFAPFSLPPPPSLFVLPIETSEML